MLLQPEGMEEIKCQVLPCCTCRAQRETQSINHHSLTSALRKSSVWWPHHSVRIVCWFVCLKGTIGMSKQPLPLCPGPVVINAYMQSPPCPEIAKRDQCRSWYLIKPLPFVLLNPRLVKGGGLVCQKWQLLFKLLLALRMNTQT